MRIFTIILALLIAIGSTLVAQSVNQVNENGKKEGKYIKYFDNNKMKYEGQFRNDIPYGLFKHYYKTGQLKAEVRFSDDGIIARNTSYYKNGKVMAQGKYINQKKDSIWNYYLDEDTLTLISYETYKKGVLNGESVTYYPESGEIAEVIEYKDGKKHGKLIKYFPDGVLMTKSYYENGQPHGDFIHNHPDGKIQIRGKYHKGVQSGNWEYYNEDGIRVTEEEFSKQEEVKEIGKNE